MSIMSFLLKCKLMLEVYVFFTSIFFKIRFNGKGFRIQSFKSKRTMNFTFGYSHIYMVHLKMIRYKRISKYKYFFKTNTLYGLNFLKNTTKCPCGS